MLCTTAINTSDTISIQTGVLNHSCKTGTFIESLEVDQIMTSISTVANDGIMM